MKRIVLLTVLAGLVAAVTALAGANGPSATGGSHLVAHDVFGLQTLELQDFDFIATTKADGSADGWFTYRDVEDGTPFSADGPVTCPVEGLGAWWHVTDNGAGANGPPDVTTFLGIGSLAATQAFCANHPAYRFPFAIDGGNIQVHGA